MASAIDSGWTGPTIAGKKRFNLIRRVGLLLPGMSRDRVPIGQKTRSNFISMVQHFGSNKQVLSTMIMRKPETPNHLKYVNLSILVFHDREQKNLSLQGCSGSKLLYHVWNRCSRYKF
jgi:hypothetical protein